MQIRSLSTPLANSGADCLIIFVDKDGQILDTGTAITDTEVSKLSEIANSGLLGKDDGNQLLLPLTSSESKSALLYRLGSEPASKERYPAAIQRLASALLSSKLSSVAIDSRQLKAIGKNATQILGDICLELMQLSYRFENYKSKKKPARPVEEILIGNSDIEGSEEVVTEALAIGQGVKLARDLGNMPGGDCTPAYLASQAESLGQEQRFSVEILDEDQMRELGMGSLLSVSAGSVEPAKLIVMTYKGNGESAPHILVGKGITFDTGGISLKPGAGMDEMKYDMCGAASVFGAMHAIASMKLPINLIGIVAAAENMPSGIATKPGDIVTSMSGKTIEVLNTDAEGRLVLCDALTYAEKFNPASIIDIATLTGAVIVALGRHASALYANDEELAASLQQAADSTGDKVWRMPLWKEYTKQLESPFADLANIGGRDAGSVTAACFLSQFTEKQKWAHLDIAGVAWKSGKAKGATGRPVKLLVEYIKSQTA